MVFKLYQDAHGGGNLKKHFWHVVQWTKSKIQTELQNSPKMQKVEMKTDVKSLWIQLVMTKGSTLKQRWSCRDQGIARVGSCIVRVHKINTLLVMMVVLGMVMIRYILFFAIAIVLVEVDGSGGTLFYWWKYINCDISIKKYSFNCSCVTFSTTSSEYKSITAATTIRAILILAKIDRQINSGLNFDSFWYFSLTLSDIFSYVTHGFIEMSEVCA